MKSERIKLASDLRAQPINFTELLWSSRGSPWAGFQLERHRIGPTGRLRHFAVDDVLLGLCVAGSAQMEFGCGSQARRAVTHPGDFTLLARGDRQRTITWSGLRETLYVRIDTDTLQRFMPQHAEAQRLDVLPQYAVSDPQVARLAWCMYDEALAGSPAGAAYGESLSLTLANYLASRYAAIKPDATGSAVLTATKASGLRDYIREHLAHNISLVELANVAGLSPHYFLQVFKNTFDVTPHHYILRERINEAKRLLQSGTAAISEVGLALGFSDQSHFSATFRRLTGRTPRQFRQNSG